MAELHLQYSLPYNYTTTSLSSWDLQNLGLLNSDMSLVMDGTSSSSYSSPFFSSLQSDFSTGYLEDALLEFNERSKRRRFSLCNDDDDHHFEAKMSNDLAQTYFNEKCAWDISETENFSCMSHITSIQAVSDETMSRSTSNMSEEVNGLTEIKTPEGQQISAINDSSSSSYKETAKTKSIFDKDNLPFSAAGEDKKRKKRVIKRVVYPFALIKPGGIEGDMTINDINQRILMPPTRPVRHPVGDFACRPCVSAAGPGLSGKAVVALTRIQTQGRGTITIIRTKG